MRMTRFFGGMNWLAVGLIAVLALPAGADEGFKPIFNGENLDGWIGQEGYWRVEDGAIVGEMTEDNPLEKNTFLIWDEGEADDFELRFSYIIDSEEANSGVQVRSVHEGDYVVAGPQPDIATVDWITGIHYEERGRGIMARRGERTTIDENGEKTTERFADEGTLAGSIHAGVWNDYKVIARGPSIQTYINDTLMNEVIDHSPEARRSGVIAFQLHTGPPMKVRFKDIELKRLPLEDKTKVVFVAGPQSHGYGAHEHRAGCMLLARLLEENTDTILTTVYTNGWPSDPTAFDNADAIVMYSDGGAGHMAVGNLDSLREAAERGVGIGAIHYAVEVEAGEMGDAWLEFMGGFFETHWSVNPWWTAKFDTYPEHDVTRGVRGFELRDEWYYHMRFTEHEGVTPIFSALPPPETLERADGPHSGNPHVREAVLEREEEQHLLWVYDRATLPGRGFGFTGGHEHWNWAHPDFRKAILNCIVWIAGEEVPEGGIETPVVTFEELQANQDYEMPERFNADRWRELIEQWQAE